jgi:hypothetical protein
MGNKNASRLDILMDTVMPRATSEEQESKSTPFEYSELANTIGLLVMKSSELDYLLRHLLAVFVAEDITDNRIYDKGELIATHFRNISQVTNLLKDLTRRVLCAWYWDDFERLFEEIDDVFKKRNSHCHNVFHILDEDAYQMSSATTYYNAMMGIAGPKKLHEKHSLKDLREVIIRTSDCSSQLKNLIGTPAKGPILRSWFLKLPDEERMRIVERENCLTKTPAPESKQLT